MRADRERWNERYKKEALARGGRVNIFLKRNMGLLPKGRVMDIASGEGRNAVFLAQQGFTVEAVDISAAGLKNLRALARAAGVRVRTILADLDDYRIEKEAYDLISSFYFLDRDLIPKIREGLKKGGKVIFETYLKEQKNLGGGPQNPAYLLRPNELLRLFRGWRILRYREGIFREGGRKKAIASLIAEKV